MKDALERTNLIEKIFVLLPSWVTGRIGPRASRHVRSWTSSNPTLRKYRYSAVRRFLIWGSHKPLSFAGCVALFAACAAYFLAVQKWFTPWRLPAFKSFQGFDISAYAGVPWAVQATLVALVYPIVLSFIALMLQRRAHSTVSLRVYLLESSVVPAGASSIGLMLLMGAQYLASPYSSEAFLNEFMSPLIAMNGVWLLLNLLLTGLFLSRTVRFIQEDEQSYAFTRIAVDVALRAELVASVKQHIFVSAPQSDWGFPDPSAVDGPQPRVYSFSVNRCQPSVTRDIKGGMALHDVHLGLLHLVAVLWSRRASKLNSIGEGETPTLVFPPRVGDEASGEVTLCSVEHGPPLRWFERLLVSMAFSYRSIRVGTLSLSARKMLEEIGRDVEAAAEQERFGAAEERLHDVARLHRTLLLAGAADAEGNVATIGISPYSWGNRSFDLEWLSPYRDLSRIAVNCLEDDPRLFQVLAGVPAFLARALPPRPETLLINTQIVGMNLAYRLAGWWMRKADASLEPGAQIFSGTLPRPLCKVYEQALVSFIGSWGGISVQLPSDRRREDSVVWHAITGRALVYAKHIENTGELLLKAVSRDDEAASVWLLESFLKWWGTRQHELDCADIEHDYRVRQVTLTLVEKDWEEAKVLLWDGTEPVTIEFATKAASLAIRRYWETVRLYLILLLIHNAGDDPAPDSRELRLAAALISAKPKKSGGSVNANPMHDADNVLTRVLRTIFGVESEEVCIDAFAERLQWDSQVPEVSGWVYSWSGRPIDMASMKRAQAILLVALANQRGTSIRRSNEQIAAWWKDIDKLQEVQTYVSDLRKEVLGCAFAGRLASVSVLQEHLGKSYHPRRGALAISNALKKLRDAVARERRTTLRAMTVDADKIRNMGRRIAFHALSSENAVFPVEKLEFKPSAVACPMRLSFTVDRKNYLDGIDVEPEERTAEYVGKEVWKYLLARSFGALVSSKGLKPVNTPDLRELYNANPNQMSDYLSAVEKCCSDFSTRGVTPVILVGYTATRVLLLSHKWGVEDWKCSPPVGIDVRKADVNYSEAVSMINDVPVFEFDTPEGDCYVVEAASLRTLTIDGVGVGDAMSVEWEEVGDEQLKLTIQWRAGFV